MIIIDSQVHAYEANTPKRPWHSVRNWPDHVTGDEMVAAMDKVGVDGAILISAFSLYRYDASYAVEVQRAHPGRFVIVKPVDPDDPAVADVIADWKSTPGAVGIRIMLTKEANREPNDPGFDLILRAALRYDLPVNILCWGNLDAGMRSLGSKKAEEQSGRDLSHRPSALSHRLDGRSPARDSYTRTPRNRGQKINITTSTIGSNILAPLSHAPTTDITFTHVQRRSLDTLDHNIAE